MIYGFWFMVFQCADLEKISRCGYEMRGLSTISVSDSVVCPKPRRIALNDHFRPSSWHLKYVFNSSDSLDFSLQFIDFVVFYYHMNSSYQTEISDAKARTELLDIILTKVPLLSLSLSLS